jgi:uncharacterized RDD family membrane protein YckC
MTKMFEVTPDLIASHGQRIANYLLDLVIMIVMALIFFVVLMIVSLVLGSESIALWVENMNTFQEYLLGAVMTVVYYGILETLLGRSPGKFITGTIIVHEDGTKPDSNTILKRTFCRLIPFDWISFLGTPSRGWHDSIPDVYVVDKKLFEARMLTFLESQREVSIDIPLES